MGRRVGDPPQETSAAPNLVHLKSQWEHGEWTKNISWDIIDITSHNYGFIYARISIIQLELHLLEDLPGHTWNHGISGQEYVFQLTGINRNLLYKVIPRDHVSEITDHYNIYIYICVCVCTMVHGVAHCSKLLINFGLLHWRPGGWSPVLEGEIDAVHRFTIKSNTPIRQSPCNVCVWQLFPIKTLATTPVPAQTLQNPFPHWN